MNFQPSSVVSKLTFSNTMGTTKKDFMEPRKDDDKRIELFYVQTSDITFLKERTVRKDFALGRKQKKRRLFDISYITICTPFFDARLALIEQQKHPCF